MSQQLELKFNGVADIVRKALASGSESCYFPTLFAFWSGTVTLNTLSDGLPAGAILEAIEQFGYANGKRKVIPEFLFFAAESSEDSIMVSGCSKEFQAIVGYIALSRSENEGLVPGSLTGVGYPSPAELPSVPAWRAMNGAIKKSKTSWWKS